MRFKIDTKQTYEQWKEQNKIYVLSVLDLIEEEESEEDDNESK